MPMMPVAPPTQVAIYSGFDYMTVDAERRRVYAAHTGSNRLLIVNADDGRELGQVKTGVLHGVAVNPTNGHVYTGDGISLTVSEVDPVAQKVVTTVDVPGGVDAIAYDASTHRLYADEDDGTRMFVIDTDTMKLVGTVKLPGHKPEFLAIDAANHRVYQNIADTEEVAVVDTDSLSVVGTWKTAELARNHPLQVDPALKHVYVGGKNGVLSTYDLGGKRIAEAKFATGVDQCSLDAQRHNLFCASDGLLTEFHDAGVGMINVETQPIDRHVRTVGVDEKTGAAWVVWDSKKGDFIQGFRAQ